MKYSEFTFFDKFNEHTLKKVIKMKKKISNVLKIFTKLYPKMFI